MSMLLSRTFKAILAARNHLASLRGAATDLFRKLENGKESLGRPLQGRCGWSSFPILRPVTPLKGLRKEATSESPYLCVC